MLSERNYTLEFPEWLEEYRLSDNLLAEAYDKFGSEARAYIKNAIALAYFHFAKKQYWLNTWENEPQLGFNCQLSTKPASWTVLIFSPGFDAAALTCAAAIMPVISKVEVIFAICLEKEPAPPLLTSLELCGIEDIFCLEHSQIFTLLEELNPSNSPHKNINLGRALLLDSQLFPSSLRAALSKILPCCKLTGKPKIALQTRDLIKSEILQGMLGSHYILTEANAECDALYMSNENASEHPLLKECSAPLILSSSCVGFWLFPELDLDFFAIQRLSFSLL